MAFSKATPVDALNSSAKSAALTTAAYVVGSAVDVSAAIGIMAQVNMDCGTGTTGTILFEVLTSEDNTNFDYAPATTVASQHAYCSATVQCVASTTVQLSFGIPFAEGVKYLKVKTINTSGGTVNPWVSLLLVTA
jgi:hypothetical protein